MVASKVTTEGTDMSTKSFAEQILDSMVDENGHCGERGLSPKQFRILSERLHEGETKSVGGAYNRTFTSTDYSGTIGRYDVRLNEYVHFNPRYTVVAIDAWIEDVPDTSASRWVGEVGERVEHEATYIGYGSYERDAFSGYGTETVYIYKFADGDGNLLVWKTTAYLEREDEDGFLVPIKRGTRLTLRGTVKSHDEYRGIKQTFLSRCRVTPRSL